MSFPRILFSACFILSALITYGQSTSGTIKGTVVEANGKPAPFVLIAIKETGKSTFTEADGSFKLEHPEGEYNLEVQMLDHEPILIKVQVKAGEITDVATIKLAGSDKHLKEVQVIGKSKAQEVKESSYNVNVIDLKIYANTTADLNQVLNRTSGIKIREEAGLGSNFNFSLNGFSGKQVKFFMDGIPMDNLGSSLTLNNFPANFGERIEVYKGVVPIWLGSDALGGAINIVTDQKLKNFADLSYSFGSFNTHRAAINTRYYNDSTGFIANARAFFNYSDNDYKVDVQTYDLFSGKLGPIKPYRRFHDAYRSAAAQVEVGVANRKYADRLLFGFLASGNHKDIQTGLNMQTVLGEMYSTSSTYMPSVKYKKENLFIKGLTVIANATYNITEQLVVDTTSNSYNWAGEVTRRTGLNARDGELGDKSLFKFSDKNLIVTSNVTYKINGNHTIGISHSFNRFIRQGSDDASSYAIAFEEPSILSKHIIGLAYTFNSTNNRFTTTLFAKEFIQNVKTTTVTGYDQDKETLRTSVKNYGGGLVIGYFIIPQLQVKSSFEGAYRLPDALEVMGDGISYLPNFYLKPEYSDNFNLGLYAPIQIKHHRFEIEANALYRNANNFIRLDADGSPKAPYENVVSVRNTGIEGSIRYTYKTKYFISANSTYQNLINTQEKDERGMINYNYKDRMPNNPYLFANIDAGFNFKNLISKKDNLSFNYGITFVEQYYLFWPSKGAKKTKKYIPQQFAHSASISYSLQDGKYNMSIECNNVSNAKLYDNYMLQKPGRAFYCKLRIRID